MRIKAVIAGFLLLFIAWFASQTAAQLISAPTPAKPVAVYFSPEGGIRDKIIAKINLARKSIKIAIYSFTSGDIAWALENAKKRGV